jgi:hypothetical protein
MFNLTISTFLSVELWFMDGAMYNVTNIIEILGVKVDGNW